MFDCPEYNICRQDYPELWLATHKNIKNISIFDNQEIVAQGIRMIRIKSSFESLAGGPALVVPVPAFIYSLPVLVGYLFGSALEPPRV